MRTLLPYVGALVAATIAVLVLAQIGENIRAATPVPMHLPLSVAGAVVVTGAVLSLLIFKVPPFAMSMIAWRASMFAGIAVGLLMFCFYVSGVECTANWRGKYSCRLVDYK